MLSSSQLFIFTVTMSYTSLVDYDTSSDEESHNNNAAIDLLNTVKVDEINDSKLTTVTRKRKAANYHGVACSNSKRAGLVEQSQYNPSELPSRSPPPPPPAFHSLFVRPGGPRDDPKQHQGRIRATPHIRGNWSTHVYLSIHPSEELSVLLQKMFNAAKQSVPNLQWIQATNNTFIQTTKDSVEETPQMLNGPLGTNWDLHLSLSRPCYLKLYQLDHFTRQLKEKLQDIQKFHINFCNAVRFDNDDQTREFISLSVGHGQSQLAKCVQAVDEVLVNFRQPTFYQPAHFHASFAWCLRESTEGIDALAICAAEKAAGSLERLAAVSSTWITKIHCRMGNRYWNMSLK
ncbi:hypothetical protein BDF19DRAFT_430193 [Syncephalis fuscata]|nr:hypothetical protein BDF19DRAFT_430193 [Syncephalis fuscata]